MNKSPSWTLSYLEDIGGSWLEFWRIWSYLVSNFTLQITFVYCDWVLCQFSTHQHDQNGIKNAVILGGHWWFLTGVLEDMIITDIKFDLMNQHDLSFLRCIQFFSSLPWLKCIKNTVIHGGCWWFLTGVLEDWVIFDIKFDIMNQHYMSFMSCISIFSSLTWLYVHQEHSHTWRMLMVPG